MPESDYLPPGIRNNNPGNIRVSNAKWQGKIESDGPYEKFESPLMGLRAMMVLLLNYHNKYGLNTIRSIINRWAPPSENETFAYQLHVIEETHWGLEERIDLEKKENLIRLAKAIVLHENGHPPTGGVWAAHWFVDDLFSRAADMVLARR